MKSNLVHLYPKLSRGGLQSAIENDLYCKSPDDGRVVQVSYNCLSKNYDDAIENIIQQCPCAVSRLKKQRHLSDYGLRMYINRQCVLAAEVDATYLKLF